MMPLTTWARGILLVNPHRPCRAFPMESDVTRGTPRPGGRNFPVASVIAHQRSPRWGPRALTSPAPSYLYRSVSLFQPSPRPRAARGLKGVGAYRPRRAHGRALCLLLIEADAAQGHYDEILVEQGGSDSFLKEQLKPELLAAACAKSQQKLQLNIRGGYDHSYYFVSTFLPEHLAWHAQRLAGGP